MRWQGLKIPVIIFSMLAGMAIIFGVQLLYQKYSFREPLKAVLNQNEAVESYQVSDEGKLLQISMTIKYDADLMHTHKEVHNELTRTLGKRSFQLTLSDSRDDDVVLNTVWYNSQYAVYQAISQGSYQDMAAVVNREAAALGAEAKIYIDQENVYLRIRHQGHTLDEVIPRDGQVPVNVKETAAGGEVNAKRN